MNGLGKWRCVSRAVVKSRLSRLVGGHPFRSPLPGGDSLVCRVPFLGLFFILDRGSEIAGFCVCRGEYGECLRVVPVGQFTGGVSPPRRPVCRFEIGRPNRPRLPLMISSANMPKKTSEFALFPPTRKVKKFKDPNKALALGSGDFFVLMDASDLIPEDALYWVAEEINAHPDVDLIFSDEDKIDIEGRRVDPYFKPDWNPALMLSQNAFGRLGVYRRSLVIKVGGLPLCFDGSQDHDLVLRCADATEPSKIQHISHILYHRRAIPDSTASSPDAKPSVWNAGARAIKEHLARNGVQGRVTRKLKDFYQVHYDPPSEWPRVQHPHALGLQT